jgi:peptidyl-prolyl cis-trans isomerase A (cyclophilin A)
MTDKNISVGSHFDHHQKSIDELVSITDPVILTNITIATLHQSTMVTVTPKHYSKQSSRPFIVLALGIALLIILGIVLVLVTSDSKSSLRRDSTARPLATANTVILTDADQVIKTLSADKQQPKITNVAACPYMKVSDLTKEELMPQKGKRHMVTPPEGGLVHLVCCQTTKGPFNTLAHDKWAPHGANRFLEMVSTGYFNAGVPLMRCLKGFLCQFGLNNDPSLSKVFKETILDDPNWLPEGKNHRHNEDGVKRFAIGYMAYAGGGPNTRDNQLIVSLDDVETLAGGSPWEVPWGELVGTHSFETFSKVYTGYAEDGPQQGDLWKEGITEKARKKFPKLDYITGCTLVDQVILDA